MKMNMIYIKKMNSKIVCDIPSTQIQIQRQVDIIEVYNKNVNHFNIKVQKKEKRMIFNLNKKMIKALYIIIISQ